MRMDCPSQGELQVILLPNRRAVGEPFFLSFIGCVRMEQILSFLIARCLPPFLLAAVCCVFCSLVWFHVGQSRVWVVFLCILTASRKSKSHENTQGRVPFST